MTKLKPYSKNLVKRALLLNILFFSCLVFGCSSSTTPTYKVSDIEKAIQDICKTEYKIEVVVKRAKETLWVYIPVEDMFKKADKPEKYTDKYEISENNVEFKGRDLNLR